MSDLERRLRADADRADHAGAPSLASSLDVAVSRRRPVAVPLAVAASVLVAGGVAVGAAHWSATTNDSADGPVTSTDAQVSGVLLPRVTAGDERRDLTVVLVSSWPCGSSAPGLPTVRLTSQSATDVRMAVGGSGPGAVVSATPQNDLGTSGAPPAGGSPTPQPFGSPTAGSFGSPAAGSTGGTPCVRSRADAARVRLDEPVGDRHVLVDGERFPLLDQDLDLQPGYLPAGYTATVDTQVGKTPPLVGVADYDGAKGAVLSVQYGAPDDVPVDGDAVGHTEVNGRPATIHQSGGRRSLVWLLPTGARIAVVSTGSVPSQPGQPLSVAQLVQVARSVG